MAESSLLAGRKAAYYTLGCKLNFAETSSVGQELRVAGVATVGEGEVADIVIVNTCSVTEVADHKGRQAISRLARRHPGALVVVMGCYAQLQPQRLAAVKGVALVVGAEERGQVVSLIEQAMQRRYDGEDEDQTEACVHVGRLQDVRQFAPACSRGDRTRYWLKVQDGCNYYCTYCTIPFARGRSRNGSIESLVAQARRASEEGGREVVLTGVNIGDFGRSTGKKLVDLLRALDKVEGIDRYRISSIEPNLLTDEVLEFCATSRAFMPHFHIPLQSGSDEVLRLMHRRYDTALFARKVARVRQLMPDAFIGVDVIVGMRGETAERFDEAERFVRGLDVSQLHVFPYSERPGTQALRIPHRVSDEERRERASRLMAISEAKLHDFYARFVGREMPVLWEHSAKCDVYHGFTPNYIRVQTTSDQQLENTITTIRLDATNLDYNT